MEFFADGDRRIAAFWKRGDQIVDGLFAFGKWIGGEVWEFFDRNAFVPQRARPAPCELELFAVEVDDDFIDTAFVARTAASLIGSANKRVARGEFCGEEIVEIAGGCVVNGFSSESSDAESPDIAGVWRDDDFGLCLSHDGGGECRRLERHALTEDGMADASIAFDAIEVIEHDGIVYSG